jgi:hypothetical protein
MARKSSVRVCGAFSSARNIPGKLRSGINIYRCRSREISDDDTWTVAAYPITVKILLLIMKNEEARL